MASHLNRLCFVSVVAAAIGYGAFAQAQDSLTGTYTGSFTGAPPKEPQLGMELRINSVDQGTVKGTARVLSGQCAGTYPMEGKYENNKLTMKATEGPCPFGFNVTQEGNKLVGSTGAGRPLQLSK
jgi:hypothetical protein